LNRLVVDAHLSGVSCLENKFRGY